MRKRKLSGTGFIQAFLVNLLLQFEWLFVALLMLALHHWIHIPVSLFWAALGFWILLSLVITWFVTWAAGIKKTPNWVFMKGFLFFYWVMRHL